MKWNILVGSLVLGFGLCTQSFGMDLLDRMLGTNYNGCSDKASCCDTPLRIQAPAAAVILDAMCNACPASRNAARHRCWTCCVDATNARRAAATVVAMPVVQIPVVQIPVVALSPLAVLKPACDKGCDNACGCAAKKCRRPLLDLLRRHHCKKQSCDAGCADPGCGAEPACGCEAKDPGCGAEPACGCETACDSCAAKCVVKKRCRVSLLDRIFGCRSCKKQQLRWLC